MVAGNTDDQGIWDEYASGIALMPRIRPYASMYGELVAGANVSDGMCVLDVGCGTAYLHTVLTEQDRHARYTGLDGSPKMLDHARVALTVAQALGAELVLADITQPTSKWGLRKRGDDRRFDRIFLINVLNFVPDPLGLLVGLADFAAPESKLVISMPDENPDMAAVLETHLNMAEADGRGRDEERDWVRAEYAGVMDINRRLNPKGMSEATLVSLLARSGWVLEDPIRKTYAGQNWLANCRYKIGG